jgi:membrane protease YdiL (CAAX protease family)
MNTTVQFPDQERPVGRVALFILLSLGGLLVFVFASPYFAVFPTNKDPAFAGGLAAALGLAALGLRRSTHYARYAPPVYALFVAAAANFALVIGPFNDLITATDPFRLMAQDKMAQFLAVVPVIAILSWLARRDPGAIFVQRGQPRRWLPFGLAGFAAGGAVMVAILLTSGMSLASLWAAAPWVLVFAAANAVMEELWFRGIFLRPYATALGAPGAVVVTALAFGISHMNAAYFEPWIAAGFGLVVVGLGVVLAWAMRWADSLWGSVLFHMGMDFLIILPVVQSI